MLRAESLLDVFDGLLKILGGALVLERLHLDPAHIAFDAIGHGIDADDVPDDLYGDRLGDALARRW